MTAPRRPSPPPPRRTLTDAAYSNWCVWPSSPPEPESSPPEPEQGVARPLRGSAAFRRAVAASAGGFDNEGVPGRDIHRIAPLDRKSTRLNSSHVAISYAVFCLKKKNTNRDHYAHRT